MYLPWKMLQQMALNRMAQLDREFTERNKSAGLLRDVLDARRSRPGEPLSKRTECLRHVKPVPQVRI